MAKWYRLLNRAGLLVMVMSLLLVGSAQASETPNKLPVIKKVTSIPAADETGWVPLPKGSGKLEIQVEATHATSVKFWIVPTGTDTWQYRQLLGEDTNPADGFSLTTTYGPERTFLDHIVLEAVGPGGSTLEQAFGVYTKE